MLNMKFRPNNRLTKDGVVYEIDVRPKKRGWYLLTSYRIDGAWHAKLAPDDCTDVFCAYWNGKNWQLTDQKNCK